MGNVKSLPGESAIESRPSRNPYRTLHRHTPSITSTNEKSLYEIAYSNKGTCHPIATPHSQESWSCRRDPIASLRPNEDPIDSISRSKMKNQSMSYGKAPKMSTNDNSSNFEIYVQKHIQDRILRIPNSADGKREIYDIKPYPNSPCENLTERSQNLMISPVLGRENTDEMTGTSMNLDRTKNDGSELPEMKSKNSEKSLLHSSTIAKHNSCSTLFVDSTMASPDTESLLRHVATLIHRRIVKNIDGYKDRIEPTFMNSSYFRRSTENRNESPTIDVIQNFLVSIFKAADLAGECAIMALIYFDRMIKNTSMTIHASNWKRMLLGAIILASKVWDDHAIWNIDFVTIFPDLIVQDLNELERYYLTALHFDVTVKASLYAAYYFELRQAGGKIDSPLLRHPLSAAGFEKLRPRTSLSENALKLTFLEQVEDTHSFDMDKMTSRRTQRNVGDNVDLKEAKNIQQPFLSQSLPLRRVRSDSELNSSNNGSTIYCEPCKSRKSLECSDQ